MIFQEIPWCLACLNNINDEWEEELFELQFTRLTSVDNSLPTFPGW